MPQSVAQFATAKYLSLESFRKTGAGVRTPVWFAQGARPAIATETTVFYIYSEADAGKVKRIRNNGRVRVAPCNFRGNLAGDWVAGRARICTGEEAITGQQLLRRKYGWQKIAGDFFSRLMRHK